MKKSSILGAIVGIVAVVFTINAVKKNEGLEMEEIKLDEPEIYSRDWMKGLSEDELSNEREKIRLEWISSSQEHDWKQERILRKLLDRFDDIILDNMNSKYVDTGYQRHREHGYYLSEKD